MSITTFLRDTPTGVIVVIACIAFGIMLRFRGPTSFALAAFTLFGTWNAGEAEPLVALVMGVVCYVILCGIAGLFDSHSVPDVEPTSGGYDHAAEQSRIADEYHRRQFLSRF